MINIHWPKGDDGKNTCSGQLGRNGCKQQNTTMNLMLVTGGTIVAEKIKRMLSEA